MHDESIQPRDSIVVIASRHLHIASTVNSNCPCDVHRSRQVACKTRLHFCVFPCKHISLVSSVLFRNLSATQYSPFSTLVLCLRTLSTKRLVPIVDIADKDAVFFFVVGGGRIAGKFHYLP